MVLHTIYIIQFTISQKESPNMLSLYLNRRFVGSI